MTTTFQAGDRVRCIEPPTYFDDLKLGHEYTVQRVTSGQVFLGLNPNDGWRDVKTITVSW